VSIRRVVPELARSLSRVRAVRVQTPIRTEVPALVDSALERPALLVPPRPITKIRTGFSGSTTVRVPEGADSRGEFEVDLWSTSNVFLAGHRLRVQVTSSSFPLWDRNLNTGNQRGTRIVVSEFITAARTVRAG
jgi:X-Pro dipeptidyl-peptidase C-terminal non-catalytic domain